MQDHARWFVEQFAQDGARLPAVLDSTAVQIVTGEERLLDVGLLAAVAAETPNEPLRRATERLVARFEPHDDSLPPCLLDPTGAVSPVSAATNLDYRRGFVH